MANDLKLKIWLEVDDKVDTSKVKKEAEEAGKEIWENVNKWMSTSIAKWMAIWDTIKGAIQKVWNMTKQFIAESINLANGYESAFAWVKKTVDWTAQEFAKLDNSLKKLAKEVPLTYQELAGIMELWGQLWVQTKDLDKFTKAVAQLWTATNLTSENAAQMLAQFANITKMDLNDIDRLWSVIVDLWNNFATTESNIVNFAQRIAGAGQIAWISQPNIMAIATAFSSVGIEAESWWTAVQKVLLDMNSAVTMWWDQLNKYAKIVWMTTDEFKKLYNEHPEQVFIKFVESLQWAGQEAQALLDALGLNDQRLVRGFLSLSQNADILTDAIARSNTAWEDNIALSNEAEQRFSTTESQIVMQQNERANMMAKIGERMQWVQLIWENIKTWFVDAIWSFLWITTESNEATEMLIWKIKEVSGEMDNLTKKLNEWWISLEEYAREYIQLKQKQEEWQKALDDEEKRIERLNYNIEKATELRDYYQKVYTEAIKKYGEEAKWLDEIKAKYEEMNDKILAYQEELITWKKLTAEEIQQKKVQKEYIDKVHKSYEDLRVAKQEYDKLKTDDSSTRAELEASRKKVEQLTAEYNKLKEAMASVWIAKSFKWILSRWNDARSKLTARANEQVGNMQSDDWWILWDLTLWWSGSWWSKSKAEDMLESFKNELKDTYDEMNDTVSDHQKNYDNLVKNIEKVESEYDKLRETASKTRKDAEKSIKSYNEQLEKNQTDAITNLWQRYVELRKDLIWVDSELKRIAQNFSRKDLDQYQTRWVSQYMWYDLKDIIELKEKLDEIKLIEENTTEEQRKSTEFLKETSKAQEILNKAKEKELELEQKKAVALEKQAIAQAMMNQEDWKQYIKTLTKDWEDVSTRYYDSINKKWEQIHDLENIEYAKQLENQSINLNDQLKQYQAEKDYEVEILTDITARKVQLEKEYDKTFQEAVAKQKRSVEELISYWDRLIAKKNEYYWSSTSARAYGWDISNAKVTLVGENWPEQIIARQASYVQPRNASNSYSTVNNNNSSNLTINWMSNSYGSIDEMLDDLRWRLTYRN